MKSMAMRVKYRELGKYIVGAPGTDLTGMGRQQRKFQGAQGLYVSCLLL